jgi:hypothetical protein
MISVSFLTPVQDILLIPCYIKDVAQYLYREAVLDLAISSKRIFNILKLYIEDRFVFGFVLLLYTFMQHYTNLLLVITCTRIPCVRSMLLRT